MDKTLSLITSRLVPDLQEKNVILPADICALIFSDDHGDRPRPLPKIKELQGATDITERKGRPSWDYDVCTSVSSFSVTVLCYGWFVFIVIGERWLEMDGASASQQEACSLWGS